MAHGQDTRTKVVATVGPASRDAATIAALIEAGVDVFRINAAHSDHSRMAEDLATIRATAGQLGAGIGVLVDLQGPKIRVGPLENAEPIYLQSDHELVISTEPGVIGRQAGPHGVTTIGCGYAGLAEDVSPGDRILLDDGYLELRVESVDGPRIHTRVVHGGLLKQYKGINLPGTNVSMASLTEKDFADLEFAIEHEADFVAISFVRSPDEVARVRDRIRSRGGGQHVISKIERPEAVSRLDTILEVSDGLMVARGDMGVELGPEVVPGIQKRIIRKAIEARKPVITATQMLESMITNPRPTRAEASDVANAIHDGSSAVMLSAETASGKHPVQAVRIMQRIIRHTEDELYGSWVYARRRRQDEGPSSVTIATVRAAAHAAIESQARAIAVITESGRTATLAAGERTPTRIIAFTPFEQTVRRLALTWGVTAHKVDKFETSHEMTLEAERLLVEHRHAQPGDRVVFIVGSTRAPGLANIMNIRVLGAEGAAGGGAESFGPR
jgi:pyruvate kinase